MEIIIDVRAGTVSVNAVSRQVVFPPEYATFETIRYDTETASGLSDSINNVTMGSIIATSLRLWQLAAPDAADMWELIKAKRTQMNASGVFVSGDWFHTDTETRGQFSIMYAAISVNRLPDTYVFDSNWKTMDGMFRPMTVSLLKKIINTGMMNESLNFANAELHKAAMMATPAPSTYDYSTGWTEVHI